MRHNSENNKYVHYSVFYREVLEQLNEVKSVGRKIFVDCTLGEGGHSENVLENFDDIEVIAFERDPEIYKIAKDRLSRFGNRVKIINDNFSKISDYFSGMEDQISLILYDFGISSYHFDVSDRGFTYKNDQPLDMRLDPKCKNSAADIVNNYNEKDLANLIYKYGEEKLSRRIAKFICSARAVEPIKTTTELTEIIMKAVPGKFKRNQGIHPATRTYQALRIAVNEELSAIEESLRVSWQYLAKGGRILAISFHSLEDRIAKTVFRSLAKGCDCVDDYYCQCDRIPKVKILTKRPILPDELELSENVRSRSAKLRICERV